MLITQNRLLAVATGFAILLSVGCSSGPTREESNAQAAIGDARDAVNTTTSAGYASGASADLLKQAEAALADGDYAKALQLARASREASNADRAINDADTAIKAAAAQDALWRDSEKMLGEAMKARDAGDFAKAAELARKAADEANDALAQHQAEMDRMNAPAAAPAANSDTYSVMSGDNLWSISAKSEIYANPYQWPLIYKANLDQIRDADLIYPNQVLNISRGSSSADVDAAVEHARSRGAWSVGDVEASDSAYAGQ